MQNTEMKSDYEYDKQDKQNSKTNKKQTKEIKNVLIKSPYINNL